MIPPIPNLTPGKKIYFASDFHLGAPDKESSKLREQKVIKWLNSIEKDAEAVFILGDIFDFWFEYKYTVPKGFIRLLGKLAHLNDNGIPVYFFTGNHDMWMFNYFPEELGIPVFRDPQSLLINNKKLMIGHGDGLGPGDHMYKFLKKVFSNRLCQVAFSLVPSYMGMGIANYWSKHSRASNIEKDEQFMKEEEWLFQFCQEQEKKKHHDFYIFGHRHLPLDMKVNSRSRYINLGEWLSYYTYGEFDGEDLYLRKFEV